MHSVANSVQLQSLDRTMHQFGPRQSIRGGKQARVHSRSDSHAAWSTIAKQVRNQGCPTEGAALADCCAPCDGAAVVVVVVAAVAVAVVGWVCVVCALVVVAVVALVAVVVDALALAEPTAPEPTAAAAEARGAGGVAEGAEVPGRGA